MFALGLSMRGRGAMRNVILLAIVLLAACQQRQGDPETWRKHCAAAAQIRVDRQMNSPARRGGNAYDVEAMKRKIEADCMKRLEREQTMPSHNSRF